MKEAFVYMWTNYDKRYIGYHKGDENDGYICSASEEFYKAYYSTSKWRRRVLARGSVKDMLKLEHKILKQVNAKDNPKYYNRSNGGIYKKEHTMNTDFALIAKIKESIAHKEVKMEKTEEIFNLPRCQTRSMNVYQDKVAQIAEKIKEAGNIEKMSPIVVVRGTDEGDQLLDGNHTIHAARKAKVPSVKVVFLEFSEFDNNELNMIGLGNALNHVDIIKTAPTNDDIKQTLMQARKLGQNITDADYKKSLAEATGRAVSAITRMSTTVIQNNIDSDVFRTWEKDQLLEEKIRRTKPGQSVITAASGGVMTDRAIGHMLGVMHDEGNEEGVLVYHHTKPKFAKEFDKRRVEAIVETTGKRIYVVELDNVPIR